MYQNTIVKIFDIKTGKEGIKLHPEIVPSECLDNCMALGCVHVVPQRECQPKSMP